MKEWIPGIRPAVVALAALCTVACSPQSKAPPRTIAHRILDLEATLPDVEPDYAFLDSLIAEGTARIRRQDTYTSAQAVAILETIEAVLVENNFVHCTGQELLSNVLVPTKLAPEARKAVEAFHPPEDLDALIGRKYVVEKGVFYPSVAQRERVLANPEGEYRLTGSGYKSRLYLALAEAAGLPVREVALPHTAIVSWDLGDDRLIWDVLCAKVRTEKDWIERYSIRSVSIEQGAYLADMTASETLAMTHVALSRSYFELKDLEKAKEHAEKAVELNPRSPFVYGMRAGMYASSGNLYQALADYTRAIDRDPAAPEGYRLRARAYLYTRHRYQALEDVNRSIEMRPDDAKAYELRAMVNVDLNGAVEARRDVEKCRELGGDPPTELMRRLRYLEGKTENEENAEAAGP